MVKLIANTILTVFQFIIRVFRKAICCLRRRRKLSCEPVALTNIGIVPNIQNETELQIWNSWEDPVAVVTSSKPTNPIQQQIELYRQQRMIAVNEAENQEQKIDYFQDMTPRIVTPTKIVLTTKKNDQFEGSHSFSLAPDPVFNTSELEEWEESQSWEDQTQHDWDANNLIREKNRLEREKKFVEQQKKKSEKESRCGRNLHVIRIS